MRVLKIESRWATYIADDLRRAGYDLDNPTSFYGSPSVWSGAGKGRFPQSLRAAAGAGGYLAPLTLAATDRQRCRTPPLMLVTRWLAAFQLMRSSKKGINAHQVHRTLNIKYKSARFMCHRIREAIKRGGVKLPTRGVNGKHVEALKRLQVGNSKGAPTVSASPRQGLWAKPSALSALRSTQGRMSQGLLPLQRQQAPRHL